MHNQTVQDLMKLVCSSTLCVSCASRLVTVLLGVQQYLRHTRSSVLFTHNSVYHALLLEQVVCNAQVDAALDESNQALVATLIKVDLITLMRLFMNIKCFSRLCTMQQSCLQASNCMQDAMYSVSDCDKARE